VAVLGRAVRRGQRKLEARRPAAQAREQPHDAAWWGVAVLARHVGLGQGQRDPQ
jgi:hypothetical protein